MKWLVEAEHCAQTERTSADEAQTHRDRSGTGDANTRCCNVRILHTRTHAPRDDAAGSCAVSSLVCRFSVSIYGVASGRRACALQAALPPRVRREGERRSTTPKMQSRARPQVMTGFTQRAATRVVTGARRRRQRRAGARPRACATRGSVRTALSCELPCVLS